MSVDPALALALRAFLALLLLWAAAHKLRNVAAFRAALAGYELLPARAVASAAALLIAAEAALAVTLLLPRMGARAGLATAALFALYGAAIAVNLWRGRRDIDCGCAGPAGRQTLHLGLVARNAVLVALALLATQPATGRSLTWLDGFTLAAAVGALALLYAAADGLLANAPRLAALRGRHP